MMIPVKNKEGFSLLELLFALVISMIVMSSTYSVYIYHQKSYVIQESVASMQRNLRASMYYMESEIRMAGYNPHRNRGVTGIGIETAQKDQIVFEVIADRDGIDNDDDDKTDEMEDIKTITYSIYNSPEYGNNTLGRTVSGGTIQPLAPNIEALYFLYYDKDGNVLNDPANDNDATSQAIRIRSVRITMVAKADREDENYTGLAHNYLNDNEDIILAAPADHYRRKMLEGEVKCRNLGLGD